MEEFSWKRDLNVVIWTSTILHNLMRAASAGLVLGIFMLFSSTVGLGQALLYILIWPIAYLIFMLPIGYFAGLLARAGVPLIGWLAIIFSSLIAIGDPLIYLLSKVKPEFVLVEKPGFFSFRIIEFVIDEDKKRRLQERALGVAKKAVPEAVVDCLDSPTQHQEVRETSPSGQIGGDRPEP